MRVTVVAGLMLLTLAPTSTEAQAHTSAGITRQAPPVATLVVSGAHQLLTGVDQLVARSPMKLTSAVLPIIDASGGSVGIELIELGGSSPLVWNYHGTEVFTAASTYKLAALMLEAQNIAGGQVDPNGLVCYQDDDSEDGWFADYADGMCYTRTELAQRAGRYSDNTAGHMLVRDVGGPDALNAWATAVGTKDSVLFTDNKTTAADLATLWAAEAKGTLGGAAAQAWLYPVLTGTATEAGVPAGVAGKSTVVHKTGQIDQVVNDAALVTAGPNGAYVLVVMTDGIGGDAAWQLISSVSSDVWTFEAARA